MNKDTAVITHSQQPRYWSLAIGLLLLLSLLPPAYADEVDSLVNSGDERLRGAQADQREIDGLYEQTRNLVDDYQQELKTVDGLKIYNTLLNRQLQGQLGEMQALSQSIADVAVLERQILPLLNRMIDALAQFIELDLPFLVEERRKRVAGLRALLTRSDVTAAEKCRRVFEAYEIETEFGRSIEAYTGKLSIDGRSYDADVLRVGRVSLMFSLLGQDKVGYWHTDKQRWQLVDSSEFRRTVSNGLRIARRETAPQLMIIPLINSDAGG